MAEDIRKAKRVCWLPVIFFILSTFSTVLMYLNQIRPITTISGPVVGAVSLNVETDFGQGVDSLLRKIPSRITVSVVISITGVMVTERGVTV